jgi:transposase
MESTSINLEQELLKAASVIQQQAAIIEGYRDLEKKYDRLQNQLSEVMHHYDWLKRQVFGQKSERYIPNDNSIPDLFGLDAASEPQLQDKEVAAHTRKSGTKKESVAVSFADSVPRVQNVIEVPEEERVCPVTGKVMPEFGEDIKEELFCTPAEYYILETVRKKYASPDAPEAGVKQVKAEPKLLRGSKFHESFLAHIVTQKFAYHMPLNRLIEQLQLKGITVSSQTMSGLVLNLGEKLKPLVELMEKHTFRQKYLFTDDTSVKMLQKGKGCAKQTHIWTYTAAKPGKPGYMIYKFSHGRGHDVPIEHLKDFKGFIHADAFGGYEKLEDDPGSDINWAACWAHARRKFEPYAATNKCAETAMTIMTELAINERTAWASDGKERMAIRDNKQRPLVEQLFEHLKEVANDVSSIPIKKIREAINYMLKREPTFRYFLDDANLRMENNTAERALRKFVIGRKNWMFFGSEKGGEAASVLMSLVQTCRNMDIDPQIYLEDIFRQLPLLPDGKLVELLPDRWLKTQS